MLHAESHSHQARARRRHIIELTLRYRIRIQALQAQRANFCDGIWPLMHVDCDSTASIYVPQPGNLANQLRRFLDADTADTTHPGADGFPRLERHCRWYMYVMPFGRGGQRNATPAIRPPSGLPLTALARLILTLIAATTVATHAAGRGQRLTHPYASRVRCAASQSSIINARPCPSIRRSSQLKLSELSARSAGTVRCCRRWHCPTPTCGQALPPCVACKPARLCLLPSLPGPACMRCLRPIPVRIHTHAFFLLERSRDPTEPHSELHPAVPHDPTALCLERLGWLRMIERQRALGHQHQGHQGHQPRHDGEKCAAIHRCTSRTHTLVDESRRHFEIARRRPTASGTFGASSA